jgi:hypothetical protein
VGVGVEVMRIWMVVRKIRSWLEWSVEGDHKIMKSCERGLDG